MDEEIKSEAEARNISRLCHFTPSRNLFRILKGEEGILSTKSLEVSERAIFAQTDLKRLDNYPTHICTSIEFPNTYYFHIARKGSPLFTDWVVLLIKPKTLWETDVLFCPNNAARNNGAGVKPGFATFKSMFATSVPGSQDRVFTRRSSMLACCPTDVQAEALVPDAIARADIIGIVFKDETQLQKEIARLDLLDANYTGLELLIVPEFFERDTISKLVSQGSRPNERRWTGCGNG